MCIDMIITVLLHELAHIIAAMLCGESVQAPEISGFGLVIRRGFSSYKHDLIVSSAGPAANIVLAVLFSCAAKYGFLSEKAYTFAGLNLLTGIYNLIPALPMDGGIMLFSFLAMKCEYGKACKITKTCALVCGVILMILGIDIMIKTRYNMSILAGSAMIIGGLYAKGAGKDTSEGHKTRKICGR